MYDRVNVSCPKCGSFSVAFEPTMDPEPLRIRSKYCFSVDHLSVTARCVYCNFSNSAFVSVLDLWHHLRIVSKTDRPTYDRLFRVRLKPSAWKMWMSCQVLSERARSKRKDRVLSGLLWAFPRGSLSYDDTVLDVQEEHKRITAIVRCIRDCYSLPSWRSVAVSVLRVEKDGVVTHEALLSLFNALVPL